MASPNRINRSPSVVDPRAESLWAEDFVVPFRGKGRSAPLTNFAGRCMPMPDTDRMARLLRVENRDRVLILGAGRNLQTPASLEEIVRSAESPVPLFDAALCLGGAEQLADPAAFCEQLMRCASRGVVETPSPLAATLQADPNLRWIVSVEKIGEAGPTLVFRRRGFVRPPFRHALKGRLLNDPELRFRWEWLYRNISHTQFEWNGRFAYRIEESNEVYTPDNPEQYAEANLDCAVCSLRFEGNSALQALAFAETALRIQPDNALAHNTRGCALWRLSRKQEAFAAFAEAAVYAPGCGSYLVNAHLIDSRTPTLADMPPLVDATTDIAENFGGKVFYAFVGYDDRLAQDMRIRSGERVLDVGGGQRPLRRADVSVDFDIFDGEHRQGQRVSRTVPLVGGDVQRLPFKDKAFDSVCCRMVLEHVKDPQAACRELQRVGRRGFVETPNTFWECFYGHPTHRWIIDWEAPTRTLIFRRKPFDTIPFRSAIVPVLYTQRDVQRAFEVTYRNITTTQIEWDEEHPFAVRVEEDANCTFDYLANPDDAARASLSYAGDLLAAGLPGVAVAEADDAVRLAPTPDLRMEATQLRMKIASALGDRTTASRLREELTGPVTEAPNAGAPLLWEAPLFDPSGYADEARHFLLALESVGASVAAREIRWSRKVATLPPDRARILRKLVGRPAPTGALHISHILAPLFTRLPGARANIGRTMFETDRLPAGWAEACNAMDAVWVPGEFNRATFAEAGVAPEKLRIVPGAISLDPFRPELEPLAIEGRRGYNFLSVFDWTLRKGWDVLIRAYIEEFREQEDVGLILKTHSSLGYSIEQIAETVGIFLTETLHRDPAHIPDIIFEGSIIPDQFMPNLYRAADCYVMPTRGEGWGRPLMEAMAMGLPTIATNWSGQTAFMTDENSLLLEYHLEEVPEPAWQETPTYRGHRWAEPDLTHLRSLMRRAFEERAAMQERGMRARHDVQQNFGYARVAQIIMEEAARLTT